MPCQMFAATLLSGLITYLRRLNCKTQWKHILSAKHASVKHALAAAANCRLTHHSAASDSFHPTFTTRLSYINIYIYMSVKPVTSTIFWRLFEFLHKQPFHNKTVFFIQQLYTKCHHPNLFPARAPWFLHHEDSSFLAANDSKLCVVLERKV